MNNLEDRVFIGKNNVMIVLEESKKFSGIYYYNSKYARDLSYKSLRNYILRNNIKPITSSTSFQKAIKKMRLLEEVYIQGFAEAKNI